MIELAHLLPDVFSGRIPLSVDDACSALLASRYKELFRRQPSYFQRTTRPQAVPYPILAWRDVTLKYDVRTVLDHVDLAVGPQEWLAIIGANGAGKTSLASLAMGFQAPTDGTIDFMDTPVAAGKISRQAASMAYLFQAADKMLFAATVEKELLFGHQHQRKKMSLSISIDQLLEVIDLIDDRDTNPFYLSHGQRKRLAIGALLARNPRVLILDEPTTGQDEGHARDFLQFLEKLRTDAHLTYLMITHNMEAVARYANRVVVLKDAHIVMNDEPAYVFARVDELRACGILPPALARLQTRLYQGNVQKVILTVPAFAQSLLSMEALS
jgi:energy-coupling factor transport system ATP-binding protein